jgi:hypothetical protein
MINLFNTFFFLFLLYGTLPITLSTIWYSERNNDLIITGQQCGCPCPEARLIKGKLSFPEKIINLHPNISNHELSLTGNSPLENFSHEIYQSEIIIEEKIIDVDTNFCSGYEFNLIPKFEVSNWTLKNYIPKFQIWVTFFFLSYIILIPLGLIINLIYLARVIIRKVKN